MLYVKWTEAKDLADRAAKAKLEAVSAAAAAVEARDLAEINETISLAALSLVEHDVSANATEAAGVAGCLAKSW